MQRYQFKKLGALLLSLLLALSLCTGALAASRAQDDFYDHVNGDWIASAVIPAGYVAVGAGNDLAQSIEDRLLSDFTALRKGDRSTTNPHLKEFIKLYDLALGFDDREAAGVAPLLPRLARIEGIESFDDYLAQFKSLTMDNYTLPYMLSLSADMKDTDRYVIYATNTSIILPDASYYGTSTGDALLGIYSAAGTQILQLCGKTAEEAAQIVQQALAFDALLAPYMQPSSEAGDYTKLYNPVSLAKFKKYSRGINLEKNITDLIGSKPSKVIVPNTKFFAAIDKIVNEENFSLIKSWTLLNTAFAATSYLTENLRALGSSYQLALYGVDTLPDKSLTAYYLAAGYFDDVIGMYYGQNYFGPEARADVTKMTEAMIGEYRSRLAQNDWLGAKTKATALKKLDTLQVRIGYPDRVNPLYDLFKVDASLSLYENALAFNKLALEAHYKLYGQRVSYSDWDATGDTVDARYNPFSNTMTFPAGILQAPFYSLEQSDSENYGGIGVIIGHEISHAFDPNGAKFDEQGNMRDWWTKSDYAEFERRAQGVVRQFDGLPYGGGAVNGTLTQSENVADLAGIACALSVLKGQPGADLDAFFTNYASIWRVKMTAEMEALYLYDVHAPQPLRVNVPLPNFEEFHETYNVQPGDGMYRAPEDRVQIW